MPLTLCSNTRSIWGLGPLVMTVRALAWVTDLTVAALSQGTPKIEPAPPKNTKRSRSRWKPEPLTIFLSGLLTISLDGKGKGVRLMQQLRQNYNLNPSLYLKIVVTFHKILVLTVFLYLHCIRVSSSVYSCCFLYSEDLLAYVSSLCHTHVVIWDSRKIRMKTNKAGTTQANIIQTGNGFFSPNGLIIQPLADGLDTVSPFGTTSF